jgi:hypothetical protein
MMCRMILYPGLSVGKNKDFIGNYSIYEHPPPQGSPRHGGAGRFIRIFQSLIRRGGVPLGAAGFIVPGYGGTKIHIQVQ